MFEKDKVHKLRSKLSPVVDRVIIKQGERLERLLSQKQIPGSLQYNVTETELLELLQNNKIKNKIIILMPDVNKLIDFVQFLPESVLKMGGGVLAISMSKRSRYNKKIMDIMGDSGVAGYLSFMFEQSQKKFFPGDREVILIVARSATRQDLVNVFQEGGENTVLVISGHGNKEKVLLSNGERFGNIDVGNQDEKIRAFVQHTCASGETEDPLGEGLASERYQYNRGTHPADFIANPFPIPKTP